MLESIGSGIWVGIGCVSKWDNVMIWGHIQQNLRLLILIYMYSIYIYIHIIVYIHIYIQIYIYIHTYICIYNYKSNSQRETVQVWFGHLPLQAHRPHDRQPFLRQVTSADCTGTSSPEKPIFCWEKPGIPHFFVGKRIFLLGKTRDSPFFGWETHFFCWKNRRISQQNQWK